MIAETVTGLIVADVQPRDLPSWSRKITDKGSWTINVLPDDRANVSVDLHSLTAAGKYSWLVLYDDQIVQGGPVFTYQYDENTRNLSVSGTGIQGLLDRRVLRKYTGPATNIVHVDNDLSVQGQTLGDIALKVVANAVAGSGYFLPIDIPTPATSSAHVRNYLGYDLATVWDRLTDLAKSDNGPEMDFSPHLDSAGTHVEWDMLVARNSTGKLGYQSSTSVWDYGGALGAIDVDVNGSASPCTTVWVRGSGSERALMVGYATDLTLISSGFPATDFVDGDHTTATELGTLRGYASADLKKFSAPTETWKCSIRVDSTDEAWSPSPVIGMVGLGDAVLLGVSGHPWIRDGMYRRRVIGFSDNTEATINLDLETTLEVL